MKQPIKKHEKWNSLIELITSPTKTPETPTPPTGKRVTFKEFRQGLAR